MDKKALKASLDTFKNKIDVASKGKNVSADIKTAVSELLTDLKGYKTSKSDK